MKLLTMLCMFQWVYRPEHRSRAQRAWVAAACPVATGTSRAETTPRITITLAVSTDIFLLTKGEFHQILFKFEDGKDSSFLRYLYNVGRTHEKVHIPVLVQELTGPVPYHD